MPESRLTPICFSHKVKRTPKKNYDNRGNDIYWKYRCACGRITVKIKKNVDSGYRGKKSGTKSCGCLGKQNARRQILKVNKDGLTNGFAKGHTRNNGKSYSEGRSAHNKGKIKLYRNNLTKDRKGCRYVTLQELEEIWGNADAV